MRQPNSVIIRSKDKKLKINKRVQLVGIGSMKSKNFGRPETNCNKQEHDILMMDKSMFCKGRFISSKMASRWSFLVSLAIICFATLIVQQVSALNLDQSFISSTTNQQQQQQQHSVTFDPSQYKNIHDAVRNHPDLREFANLCDSDGVKEIISMDKMALTVFAPIDRSLNDLLSKSKSINLIELAKHHIVQGLVMPDENTKYPQVINSFLAPLYLNQLTSASSARPTISYFVNNAKIIASHLIPIDGDNFQTLHIIDQPLEFAYLSRAKEVRQPGSSVQYKKTLIKRAFNLLELASNPEAGFDFYERFSSDLNQANSTQIDLYHARIFKGSHAQAQLERLVLTRDQFNLEAFLKFARKLAKQTDNSPFAKLEDSQSVNTYFLPINFENFEHLQSLDIETLNAHVIRGQALFTRTMPLGSAHLTSNNPQRVSLSLAKTLPDDWTATSDHSTRRLLATPLLVQSKCSGTTTNFLRSGVTSAEILVANIPLSNGVLHLIKKPLLLPTNNLLDYLNDHDNELSNTVNSLGSQTGTESIGLKVNRFRELLARERNMLASFSQDSMSAGSNVTILAPSDEAFAKLRFDLRALVQADESLIPRHWDDSYRRDLLERLVKRHVVSNQVLISDQLLEGRTQQILTENGKMLTFSSTGNDQFQVDCDGSQAKLIQHDLIASNGVLHIIDRVLGEEQETVYSLLKSFVIKFNNSQSDQLTNPTNQLNQLIENNIQSFKQETMISATNSELQSASSETDKKKQSPELALISKSIGQYLDELASSNPRQLHLLAASVNISYQLAKLTSMADGLEDWNDKFKSTDRQFTYFVPSDLAWMRLQQAQPELHKALMYFLNDDTLADLDSIVGNRQFNGESGSGQVQKSPRSSESSHRLRKILERHLVVNKKIGRKELNEMDFVHTIGATLRLVDSANHLSVDTDPLPEQMQLESLAFPSDDFLSAHDNLEQAMALHSIAPLAQQQSHSNGNTKALRLESAGANIVQVDEASNGFVYIIDGVLLQLDDADYIVQTSSSPAVSSTMSSLLGAHNSAILDFIHSILAPSPFNMSAQSIFALIGTLTLAIISLLLLAIVLIVRRRRQTKLNRHQQLESGLTSSSSANSGSTSTTKSL